RSSAPSAKKMSDATFESILADLYNSDSLPESTQDDLPQAVSMDLEFLDNLESLTVAGPDGCSMSMDFNDFLNWADTPAPPVT
ncbi:hypothetical protein CDAR_264831, partial [Caerostris darwini]